MLNDVERSQLTNLVGPYNADYLDPLYQPANAQDFEAFKVFWNKVKTQAPDLFEKAGGAEILSIIQQWEADGRLRETTRPTSMKFKASNIEDARGNSWNTTQTTPNPVASFVSSRNEQAPREDNNTEDLDTEQEKKHIEIYRFVFPPGSSFDASAINLINLTYHGSFYGYVNSVDFLPSLVDEDGKISNDVYKLINLFTPSRLELSSQDFYLFKFFDASTPVEDVKQIDNKFYVLNEKTTGAHIDIYEDSEITELTLIPFQYFQKLKGLNIQIAPYFSEYSTRVNLTIPQNIPINAIEFKEDRATKSRLSAQLVNASNIFMLRNFINLSSSDAESLDAYYFTFDYWNRLTPYSILKYCFKDANGWLLQINRIKWVNNREQNDYINSEIIRMLKLSWIYHAGGKEEQEQLKDNNAVGNLKDWSDRKIEELAKFFKGNQQKINEFHTLILMLSRELVSSYAWGGGRKSDHKLFLYAYFYPLYIFEKEQRGNEINPDTLKIKLYLKSDYFDFNDNASPGTISGITFKNIANKLNANITQTNEGPAFLDLLPSLIENKKYSTLPLDFNAKTNNFNYSFYIPLKSENVNTLLNLNQENASLTTRTAYVERSSLLRSIDLLKARQDFIWSNEPEPYAGDLWIYTKYYINAGAFEQYNLKYDLIRDLNLNLINQKIRLNWFGVLEQRTPYSRSYLRDSCVISYSVYDIAPTTQGREYIDYIATTQNEHERIIYENLNIEPGEKITYEIETERFADVIEIRAIWLKNLILNIHGQNVPITLKQNENNGLTKIRIWRA